MTRFELHHYPKAFADKNPEFARNIEELVKQKFSSSAVPRVDLYNYGGFHDYDAGSEDRLIIFNNATYKGAQWADTGAVTKEIDGVNFMPPKGTGILLKDVTGLGIAEYFESCNTLNILFDAYEHGNPSDVGNFSYIFDIFNAEYWDKLALKNSWLHSATKDKLIAGFKERAERQTSRLTEDLRSSIRESERKIRDYKDAIKSRYDNLIVKRRELDALTSGSTGIVQRLFADIDLVLAHPKVTDLHIVDDKIHLFIPDVNIYTENDDKYYIGDFRIEIKMENSDVRFFNLNNPRRSYWTETDPHPHVNGEDGSACLGNVSSTIAELCSRNELYALSLVILDFLESVNLSDPAGERIKNWDKVDEDGNVIQAGGTQDEAQCYECDDWHDEDDLQRVYLETEVDDDGDEYVDRDEDRLVCESCRDGYYHFNEEVGEYVRD